MERVIKFFGEYYREILFIFGVIVEAIISFILLVKKSKKVVPVEQSILMMIPSFIRRAEDMFGDGHGLDKLRFVVGKIKSYYEHETGQSLEDGSYLLGYFTEYVENVLKTPQKKGDK